MKIAKWILAPVLMLGVQQASAALCAQALNAAINNAGKDARAGAYTATITGTTRVQPAPAPATQTATLNPKAPPANATN